MRNFLFTSESAWYWTIIAVAIVALITVFTIPKDLYPLAYVRNVLGVIFVLFLPGYAFIKAFFPTKLPIKTSSESLDNIERVALSIGLSIALTSIDWLNTVLHSLGYWSNPNNPELASFDNRFLPLQQWLENTKQNRLSFKKLIEMAPSASFYANSYLNIQTLNLKNIGNTSHGCKF